MNQNQTPQYPPYSQPADDRQTQQPGYGQPVGYYYVPVPVQSGNAPVFAVKPPRDPRCVNGGKTFNRLCLTTLLQTLLAFVFVIPITALSVSVGVDLSGGDDVAYLLMNAALVPLSTALPFFLYLKIGRKETEEYLRFEKVGFFTAMLCVLAGLSVVLLANYPSMVIQDFFDGFGYEPLPQLSVKEQTWLSFGLEFAGTAILVPMMEEFAFRGVLCSALQKYGRGFAIIGSALVFSLVHLDFSNVIFAFIAGLVFGFLYVRTNNLWITVFIHSLNNGFAVISTFSDFFFGESAAFMEEILMMVPVGIGLLALVILLPLRRKMLFSRPQELSSSRPLSAGESAGAIVRAPLFWVLVAMMMAYTTSLFF